MQCGSIPNGDNVFRHSIFPNGFPKNRFSHRGIIKFFDRPDGSILGSVTWQRFFPTTEHVHEYGCRLAAKQNRGLVKRGEYNEKRRRVYCGAYQFTAQSVRALATIPELNEIAYAEVIHHPEDGEIAHTDLRVIFKETPANVATTKTAIIDRLWAASCGPLAHVCDCDTDVIEHPNRSLIDPPGGAYVDHRGSYLRLWRIVRLKLCEFFYRMERAIFPANIEAP